MSTSIPPDGHKLSILDIVAFKARNERIAMVTAYDHPSAALADSVGMDVILVGDSIGDNVLGYASTLPVSMDEMTVHTRAVSTAVRRAFVVGDLPYMSYHPSRRDALLNAGRLMSEGQADCVKLEGGAYIADTVSDLVGSGIPVMGHIGLTPQSAPALGGFKVQGREASAAARLVEDALKLQESGAFAVVLEAVPAELAEIVTRKLSIPTIGIGAGPHCDGQVLVFHDLFGLSLRKPPKFAKQYADIGSALRQGFADYRADVKAGSFPDTSHSYRMKAEELERLHQTLDQAE